MQQKIETAEEVQWCVIGLEKLAMGSYLLWSCSPPTSEDQRDPPVAKASHILIFETSFPDSHTLMMEIKFIGGRTVFPPVTT